MIQKLTKKKELDEIEFIEINANEILARDGIHGKIAGIGKGFGTGRHTAERDNLNNNKDPS